jgi:HEAT repeat protein
MAKIKRDRTLEALERLSQAVEDPHSKTAKAALTKALGSRSNLVIAAALEVIYEHELPGFEAAMVEAFNKAMIDSVRTDPGCRTKVGVVKTLDKLGEPADELFLAGVRYRQPEPVWGGSQDSAIALRGMSAMALVNRRHHEAMTELARLLADPEREARRMAADAVAASGDVAVGVPLLILRVRAGDPDVEVLSACFAALLALDAEATFEFVVEHLRNRDALVVEAAVLAIGQERPAGALPVLREFVEQNLQALRRIGMLSIAMLRTEEAWAYLLELIADGPTGIARDAIEALGVYRELADLGERARDAVARRADKGKGLERVVAESLD